MLTCVAFSIKLLDDSEDSTLPTDMVAVPVLKLFKICLVCDKSISVSADADEAVPQVSPANSLMKLSCWIWDCTLCLVLQKKERLNLVVPSVSSWEVLWIPCDLCHQAFQL